MACKLCLNLKKKKVFLVRVKCSFSRPQSGDVMENCSVADRSTAGSQVVWLGWGYSLSLGPCLVVPGQLQPGSFRSVVRLGILKAMCSHPGQRLAELADTPQVLGRGFLYQLGAGPDDVEFLCYSQHAYI